jgi:two-component system, NtrC family, sensor histidine kinase PilS
MADTELLRRLRWLIATRAIIGTLLLGGATVVELTGPGRLAVDPFFLLIAANFALTAVSAGALRTAERRRWLIDVQLACDAAIVSAFVYVTGGITSVFSSLYVVPIVAGSLLRHRRGGLTVAGLSSLMFVSLVTMQFLAANGQLPASWPAPQIAALPTRSVAQYVVVLNLFGYFAVAWLSGAMSESARTAGAQLQQASSEIADLQALNQHVIDSLPSGLLTTDTSQRVLTFNHAAETICGMTFQSVLHRHLVEVLQMPGQKVEELNEGLRSKGAARRLEFRYKRPDGRDIDLGLTATHLESPGGRVGYLVTFQDLTDIKRLERDARMQQRLAAVGEMAAGIAHEIRNPLASMSGSIQILRQELPLSSEQEQLMDIVLRESERLNTTIRSFLAYARPQRFAVKRFDIRGAIQDTALLLRNSSEISDKHAIEVDVKDEPLWFEADENQIKQVIWNLATNGVRAMPDGGRLRLAAGYDDKAHSVLLTVQDEGIGIPPEEIDTLFQPFHGSFAKGSGLGLAIVHRIVTDYRGVIQVSSRRGSGTIVSVRLPAHAEVTT